jgi:hypothetical protein
VTVSDGMIRNKRQLRCLPDVIRLPTKSGIIVIAYVREVARRLHHGSSVLGQRGGGASSAALRCNHPMGSVNSDLRSVALKLRCRDTLPKIVQL